MIKTTRQIIFGDLQTRLREVQALEENGYSLDDHQYMKGVAYWWYDIRDGGEQIQPTLLYSKPEYPRGDWRILAFTLNGEIMHEESRLLELYINNPEVYYE